MGFLTVGTFLIFLVCYGLWAWGCYVALQKLMADLAVGKSFWGGELVLLASYSGLFCFLYLLSGFWNLWLVLLFFATAQLGTLLAWLVDQFLGAQSEKSCMRSVWAGKEIEIKHPLMNTIATRLMGLVFLAFPVAAGVVHFQHAWSSEALKILIVKCSLLLLIFGGYPLTMIVTIMMLVSENLDEETRLRIFVNQLVGMIPTALIVAFAIWVFGIGGPGLALAFGGVSGTVSLRALLLVLLFFAFSVLIPYFLGTLQGKRRRLAVSREMRDYVDRLADILDSPTGPLYASKLTGLSKEAADERSRLIQGDALLTLAEQIDTAAPGEIPDNAKPVVAALKKTRDLDPRFKLLDNLAEFADKVQEIIVDLQRRSDSEVEKVAEVWSTKIEKRKAELEGEIKATESMKGPIVGVLGTMAMTVVSAILEEVGKASWEMISHSGK